MDDSERLVVVASFFELFEADLVRMRLQEEGIEPTMAGEATLSLHPLIGGGAGGGIRLLVADADAEAAAEILRDYYRERAEAELARSRTCPQCQETLGEPVRRSLWFGLAAVFTLGVFCLLIRWPRYRCRGCGTEWR